MRFPIAALLDFLKTAARDGLFNCMKPVRWLDGDP